MKEEPLGEATWGRTFFGTILFVHSLLLLKQVIIKEGAKKMNFFTPSFFCRDRKNDSERTNGTTNPFA